MKTVALEDLVLSNLVVFCENIRELGCPADKKVEEWFLGLSLDEGQVLADKLLDIHKKESQKEQSE